MLFTRIIGAALLAAFCTWPTNAIKDTQWPIHDDGFTDIFEWDHYSPMIKGERFFLWSGEFHYWRIPVPELWRDILEKVKAAGFNAVSVYSHWAFHAASPDALDFESGAHDFTSIFTIAKEVGLYVIFRGGPYVNAETTAGAFALWTTTGAYGSLRDDDPRYTAAWQPYIARINTILAEHQLTNGGNVIMQQLENETPSQFLSNGSIDWALTNYMLLLEESSRDNGVEVPLFTNAPNMNTKSWSHDYMDPPGAQDIYAVDSYPYCWSCNLDECDGSIDYAAVNYHDHFDLVSISQPSFIAEFQGGAYNPWGGPEGGCANTTGPSFANIYYRHLVAERLTMVSLYMLYGGTNWGGLATNLVATSYDYSAPIEESRQIGDKMAETKLLGLFLRTAQDLRMTDRHNFTRFPDSDTLGSVELRNPATGAAFYVLEHSLTNDTSTDSCELAIRSSLRGNMTIPQYGKKIVIDGQQTKILPVDFAFGNNTLIYSTAEVLSHTIVDSESVLALWLPERESGEFRVAGGSQRREVVSGTGGAFHDVGDDLVVSFVQQSSQAVLQFDNFRVLLLPRPLAYRFWAPSLGSDPLVRDNEVIFVTGPYLVRGVKYDGTVVSLTGDLDWETKLEVWAPKAVDTIEWNGLSVPTERTSYGTLVTVLNGPSLDTSALESSIMIEPWKFSEALPEVALDYDDTGDAWVVADLMTSPNPTPPLTYPSLYADEYGFHTGVILFRGKFNDSTATGANLTIQGGTAFGWSAYVNGISVGSFAGNTTAASSSTLLSFTNATLGDSNVLTIVMDHSGHNQRAEALFPRGILGASLISPEKTTLTEWKIAGNAGGESNIDPVRGPIAEGGLHAERLGWHLPGFDDSDWERRDPGSDGISNASIGFFRTSMFLDVAPGLDASIAFVLNAPFGSILRAQLYVNGYQYGKFVPQVGNQKMFPVPPGILDYRGNNTIGLSIWSQTEEGAKVEVFPKVLGVYESAFDVGFDSTYLRPGWTEERARYA